jgi:hypothetical protein
VIDIEKINKRHFLETDMYYRIEKGLSSRLVNFANGIFHLELVIGRKWDRNYSAAAAEMAYCWKRSNEELNNAIACKVYIIDVKKNPYKQVLLHTDVDVEYDAKKGILFYKNHLN